MDAANAKNLLLGCIILVVGIVIVVNAEAAPNVLGLRGIDFRSASTFFSGPNVTLYHMEWDLYQNHGEWIMFGNESAILTTNGSNVLEVATGFRWLEKFTQINRLFVVAADYGESCLKLINRENDSVRVLAGLCDTYNWGYDNGIPGQFKNPWQILVDRANERLLVQDVGNGALRTVDLNNGHVDVLIPYAFYFKHSMTWFGVDQLLVADWEYVALRTLGGGWMKIATFTNRSDYRDITHLENSLYLLSDFKNCQFQLLDVDRQLLLPVSLPSNYSRADRGCPYSLMKGKDGNVYAGSGDGVITKFADQRVEGCLSENLTTSVERGETTATIRLDGVNEMVLVPGVYQYTSINENCTAYVTVEPCEPDNSTQSCSVNDTKAGTTVFIPLQEATTTTKKMTPAATSSPPQSSTTIDYTCYSSSRWFLLKPGETTAVVKLGGGRTLVVGVGTHEFTSREDGCNVTVTVEKVGCSTPPTGRNWEPIIERERFVGSSVHCSCADGYRKKSGDSVLTCGWGHNLAYTEWEGSRLICEPITDSTDNAPSTSKSLTVALGVLVPVLVIALTATIVLLVKEMRKNNGGWDNSHNLTEMSLTKPNDS